MTLIPPRPDEPEKCEHPRVRWTVSIPYFLSAGAICLVCSHWWREDHIPAPVLQRLKGRKNDSPPTI